MSNTLCYNQNPVHMIKFNEYNNLWTNPAPNGFNQVSPAPSYHEYIQRAIYQQDYLDLFTGVTTFPRVNLKGFWLVEITSNSILNTLLIPLNSPHCININGVDYLKVGYDYPWSPMELTRKRAIKYIMIGEAPRPLIAQTYFYSILETTNTPWLNAPVDAFASLGVLAPLPVASSKRDKLLFLADNGYILIDLFPFAIDDYSPLRNYLNQGGVSEYCFNNFVNRKMVNFHAYNLFNKTPVLAFSGPGIIHHYLADKISIGSLPIMPDYITCRSFQNHFGIYTPSNEQIPALMIPWPNVNALNGIYPGGLLSQVPFYRCCCFYVGGNYAPHSLLIQNAFF